MTSTAERYRRFAREQADRSRFAVWAETVAADDDCLALIDTLAELDREPAIVLWAAQASGLGAHGDIRAWLEGEWDAVAELAHARQRALAAAHMPGA
ncbi:hypothetical protein [Microcella humidisoli]|uniref:Uncharacterized protein n=1 Tax=Microcella humidisoli TaxID=2963406 RepID=A0ABY5FT85_9MICO|nr:hypothetical protein [Microcella humidisoli]UTT61494.1 hypothetical protein NNL39_07315 [Microcella humidisoli]